MSTNGGNTWGNSTAGGYNTASMWVNVTDSNGGYRYRCKVTDSAGNVVYSEPGEIKLARETWTFTYDADGMRTQRSSGSATYNYVYNGSQLSQMTVDGNTLYFAYDASGTPLSVTYNGTTYYYATNLQGDITAILNTSGTAVVTYTYDAWGHILSTSGSMASTLGTHNPLRYRGYVYDTETGLYYLQSRYYNPQVGRFLNTDGYASTGQGVLGNNMFAYCLNNPISFEDDTGQLLLRSNFVQTSDQMGGSLGAYVGLAVGAVAAGTTVLLGPMIQDAVTSIVNAVAGICSDVYEYSKAVKAELAEAKRKAPHVHHIVTIGYFLGRSVTTQMKVWEMHKILADVGINRWIDPHNLMLVSAGSHASLHTDAYIEHVYSYIKPAAGNKTAIYTALFALRLEIAAWDIHASGY